MVLNLKKVRSLSNKNQKQVATELNINTTTYNNWENSVTEPSIENLAKLADYFNVSIDYLVGREFKNDIGFITGSQHKIISDFLSLDETNQTKVAGYIDSLKDTQKS